MSDETPAATPTSTSTSTSTVIVRRPVWQTIAKWVAIVIVGLLLLVAAVMLGINTQPGRRFVADRIAGYTMANGLNFKVGRIDGSIYGDMILRDVRVQDQRGTFLTSPELRVDWRPFAFASNHVDVRSLTSPLVAMSRLPELKETPSDPDAPLLPDLDIDVNRFAIERIDLAPAVSGTRRLARVSGTAHIADRRAQVTLDGATLNGPGIAGGDRVALKLDAVPDDDKFDLDLKLNAPANGLVAGLATLEAPLTLDVSGQGSWQNWSGRAVSTLGGGSLANLNIQGRDGKFNVRGTTQPGLYLKGPVERLTAPRLDVAIDAALADRVADMKVLLRSSALQVTGDGKIDLARSRFSNFKTTAMLLTPGAIAPNLRGRSVNIALALDGAFATPLVDYKLTADAIGFGETTVEGVYAEGRARVDADRIMVPIAARARRVTGLNAAAGGLLTNVSINGDLAIKNGTELLSDNLRIRSDRIDATAIVAANLSTGRYAGALKGRVNDYQVEGFGIVNLTTDAELYTVPSGGFGIRGRVVAQTSRIFNDGAREFLGGNAIARVNLDYTPQGIITFSNLRVTAPQFRVTNGSGRYDPAGPLLVNADAYSTVYGPVSARVTGTLFAPVATIRAARPGLGVGLAGVTATIRGQGTRYAIVATGGSDYGPFSADLLLSTGPALTADIRRARFAGIDFTGRVQQTSAGPFAGRLAFNGSGVNGTLNLAAQGAYQRADVDARALNAVIPGTAGLTIGRAIIVGTAVLYDQPAITGDAQVANLKMGEFVLRTARAKIDYRGGSGTAQALAEGSSGVPFRIAANARFSPELWLAALQGTANGINFKTASPARIVPDRGTYRLQPTRIDFDQGSLRLAGTYGAGMTLQSRLDRLNLSIANAFVPGLGLGGTATGSLDFSQPAGASFPTADAKLRIANFTRSSLASVSTPVNIVFAGRLLSDGGEARALVQRGTTTIGRVVATLRPLPAGAGAWTTRLTSAPLSGGIRYNGPAGVLFSLGGLTGQQLSGPIAVAADFGGRVSAPRLTGVVKASNLTYDNEIYGTRLSNMQIDGRFNNDRFELTTLNARAGDGTIAASGSVGLAADSGFPIDIRATLNDARLARSDAIGATATGTIRVTNSAANGGLIEGDLLIPEARYEIIRQGAAEVPELTGVRRKSDVARAAANPQAAAAGPPGLFKLALRVHADNRLYVSGMGLESEWLADIRIGGTSAAPSVTGQARIVRGTYSFSGKRFDVTRGIVRFEGGPIGDPSLDIAATTTAEGISATIAITGSALDPRLTFTSTPALPQDEVLSRLLFGSSVTNLSATQALQLASALNGLRGSGGGLNPLGKLRSVTGIDRLRILGADEATGRGTAVAAGQYLTDDIYIEIITDSRGFTATQLEIALSRALSLLSSTGSFGGSNASLRYSKDY